MKWYLMVILMCICWASFEVLVGHLSIFFGEMSVQVDGTFLKGVFVSLSFPPVFLEPPYCRGSGHPLPGSGFKWHPQCLVRGSQGPQHSPRPGRWQATERAVTFGQCLEISRRGNLTQPYHILLGDPLLRIFDQRILPSILYFPLGRNGSQLP